MRILALPGSGLRSLNPYCHLLYSNMEAEVVDFSGKAVFRGYYDVFHLHWLESDLNISGWLRAFLRVAGKLLLMDLLRLRGTKIVWTAHNLKSHEQRYPRLEAWFWKRYTRRLDGVIALTEAGLDAARMRFPALQHIPGFVISHGHYRDEYSVDPTLDARERLGVSGAATVVLFFGQVRPYKGIDTLIQVFRESASKDLELWIVGKPRSFDYAETVNELAGQDTRIHLRLHFIPAEDVQLYFGIADLVVLPYKDILNSGTAMLSLSFNTPVVVPKLGAMEELSHKVGREWVMVYEGALTAKILEGAAHWANEEGRGDRAPLECFDWRVLGMDTLSAFHQICNSDSNG